MNLDDLDQEDEGWIWLPWEELQELQRKKNAMMRDLMDNMSFASPSAAASEEKK